MFEQSLLLHAGQGAKARALAVSLTTQCAAASVLLLVPLIYTDRIAMGHITLPTTLQLAPTPPPPQQPVEHPVATPHRPVRPMFAALWMPTHVPPLNPAQLIDEPAIVESLIVDNAPAFLFTGILKIPVITEPPPPPEVKPVSVGPAPQKPFAVGGTVLASKLIHRVVPAYPLAAKLARVSGTVHLVGVVSKEGMIEQLQVVSGNPLLIQAAMDAVKQWVYSPTLLNGKPVEVSAPIDVIFTLSQ